MKEKSNATATNEHDNTKELFFAMTNFGRPTMMLI